MRKQKVFAMLMAAVLSAGAFLAAGGATALTEVRAAETTEKTEGDWSYTVLDDGTAEITGYSGEATKLVVPESIGGVKVTVIGDSAFYGCSALTTVTISNGVLSIGDGVFEKCKALSEINIPASVEKIEIADDYGKAFGGCDSLGKITVDANNKYYSSYDDCLYNKDKSVLIRCPEMKKGVTVYEGTERIVDRAFVDCRFLKSVKLPSAVKNLAWGTFYGCTELESVTLPDSFEGINYNAFGECEKFNTLKLYENGGNSVLYNGCLYNKDKTKLILVPPAKTDWMLESGLTEIGEGALGFNQAEKTFIVPDTVKKVGDYAFAECKANLDFIGECPELGYGWFGRGYIKFIPSPEWNEEIRAVDGNYDAGEFVYLLEAGFAGGVGYMKTDIIFTGLFKARENDDTLYYFTDGKLDKSFNGEAEYGGKKYVVENGKAVSEVTDISVNIESIGELLPKLESTGEDALAAVSKLLTEEQLAAVRDGKASLDIKLSVAKIDGSVTAADKELIEKAVESISDGAKLNFKVMNYLDIKLGALIDGKELAVTETAAPLTVSVALENPAKGSYKVVRLHGGKAEAIDAELSKDGTRLIFKTDKFSTYAIAYSDVASGDGANTVLTVILCLAGLAGLAAAAAATQKKRHAA